MNYDKCVIEYFNGKIPDEIITSYFAEAKYCRKLDRMINWQKFTMLKATSYFTYGIAKKKLARSKEIKRRYKYFQNKFERNVNEILLSDISKDKRNSSLLNLQKRKDNIVLELKKYVG